MHSQFTIETETVRLRAFSMADYRELFALSRQAAITDLLPDWNMSEEQLADFLRFVISSYDKFDPSDVRILLAVEHKGDNRLIGWCGVFPNDMLDPAVREAAYAISEDYRGRGYMTTAVKAIVSFVFGHTELERVVAIVKPFNTASLKVLEKAGFSPIRTVKLSDGQDYAYFENDKEVHGLRRIVLEHNGKKARRGR